MPNNAEHGAPYVDRQNQTCVLVLSYISKYGVRRLTVVLQHYPLKLIHIHVCGARLPLSHHKLLVESVKHCSELKTNKYGRAGSGDFRELSRLDPPVLESEWCADGAQLEISQLRCLRVRPSIG